MDQFAVLPNPKTTAQLQSKPLLDSWTTLLKNKTLDCFQFRMSDSYGAGVSQRLDVEACADFCDLAE